jgi:beta-propeller repeat-containing protein
VVSSDVCYNSGDYASAVVVDGVGNLYIAGTTGSPYFPTVHPFQDANRAYAANGTNAFVAKLAMAPELVVGRGLAGVRR